MFLKQGFRLFSGLKNLIFFSFGKKTFLSSEISSFAIRKFRSAQSCSFTLSSHFASSSACFFLISRSIGVFRHSNQTCWRKKKTFFCCATLSNRIAKFAKCSQIARNAPILLSLLNQVNPIFSKRKTLSGKI